MSSNAFDAPYTEYVNAPVPPEVWFVIVICWFISVDETFGVIDIVGSWLTVIVTAFDVAVPPTLSMTFSVNE